MELLHTHLTAGIENNFCEFCTPYQVRCAQLLLHDVHAINVTTKNSMKNWGVGGGGVRPGPAKKPLKRQIGHARINLTKLDLKFGNGVVRILIDTLVLLPPPFLREI